jgi:GT2 family glycosyltransferase
MECHGVKSHMLTNYQPRKMVVDEIEAKPTLEDITVVIPTLGRAILEESLYWIVAGSAWPGGLVVVDQGSNPSVEGWIKILRLLGIKAEYLPSSQRGRAAGINRGLERVQTRFVAITDDDCFVNADWLETMVKYLRDNPEAVVTGRIEAAGENVVIVVTSQTPAVYRRPQLLFDHMSGGNVGTSMHVIESVGMFEESPSMRTAEDAEWAYRALRSGVPIMYQPEVVVAHFGWRDKNKRSVVYRDYAKSHGGFYGKYLRKGDLFIALRAVLHHLRALRRWLGGIVTNDNETKLIGRAYLTGLLPGIITGLRNG